MSLDEEWQGSMHFFQGSPSRCADFKSFSNADIANLSGLTAAEVGFLVVKPFKKHPFLAGGTKGGQTGNAPCLKRRKEKLKQKDSSQDYHGTDCQHSKTRACPFSPEFPCQDFKAEEQYDCLGGQYAQVMAVNLFVREDQHHE